jgi:flagellum-specific peptidoglycan hydrolase FlgJ
MATIPADVIAAAKASMKKHGIPASVSLAQWAVESGWGKHYSGKNNPFGIKDVNPADGAGTLRRTREWSKQRGEYFITVAFKDYASIAEAFDDHGRLLAQAKAYAVARSKLPNVNSFCNALTGVYATDPNYGKVLISVIDGSQKLRQYDQV